MENNKTLLIMAAGMGTRFGGLKQIEPVGPNGEFLIDYSIYDAMRAGFNKVVFVIKEENEQVFKETIGNRLSKFIKVEYVFQKIEDVPEEYVVPKERYKPWGTGHAIFAARKIIKEPFAVINADDFYGREAYEVISNFLDQSKMREYCIVGYKVKHTLSENGTVKRAVCLAKDGKLQELIESSIIERNGQMIVTPLDGKPEFCVEGDTLVSVNLLGFHPDIFSYLEKQFNLFLIENKNNLEKEYFIPEVLCNAVKENYATVSLLTTDAKWLGITYKEDKDIAVRKIKEMIEKGEYPKKLWK